MRRWATLRECLKERKKKIYIYICKKRSDERKKNLINSMTCAKAIEKIIEFTLFLFFFTFHCDYLYVLVLYYYCNSYIILILLYYVIIIIIIIIFIIIIIIIIIIITLLLLSSSNNVYYFIFNFNCNLG